MFFDIGYTSLPIIAHSFGFCKGFLKFISDFAKILWTALGQRDKNMNTM
jgi:hypothetical protein